MIINNVPSPDEGPTTPPPKSVKKAPRPPMMPKPAPKQAPKMRDLTMQEPDDGSVKYAKGGYVRAADGIAQRGKTRGKLC